MMGAGCRLITMSLSAGSYSVTLRIAIPARTSTPGWLPRPDRPRSLDFRFIDVVRLPNRGMGIATVRPMSYFRTPQLDDVILAGREDILKKT